ncbi:MAG: signal transduction protein [Candidatus Scalindua rubra]|uniref:Signal transduction protein n=1 Tax=Candidatus Scalindua rubra TaxID=1872076 RepID=A0A1E3XBN1_9BACT|nr:MAG: signal transduction protein [Candidatus Scalindua rubra]
MDPKAASILTAQIETIPTLPIVAVRVIEITSAPKSSANDLMDVISPDISLTTKILKIANSPFYGLTREISSLQHAVTVLGFTEIRNLVISTVAFESFKDISKNGKFDIKKFWRHSFGCALAAKIIATDLKNASNELFVAGLIHDIGKLVIYVALPMEFLKLMEIMSPIKLKFIAFEADKKAFGMTHDEVGMRLLKRWMFPKSLMTAVGFHHRPQEADKKSPFSLIVHIADILTHIYEMQAEGEEDELFKAESFYPDIINLARSFGINWDVSDLNRFQQALVESMEKEVDTMSLFF